MTDHFREYKNSLMDTEEKNVVPSDAIINDYHFLDYHLLIYSKSFHFITRLFSQFLELL